MKRRNLIKGTFLLSGTGTLSACQNSDDRPIENQPSVGDNSPAIRWRMATSWPKFLDILFGGAESICRQVNEMTDGRFTITPYAAEEIVPGFGVLDAVADGTVECGHTASYYYFDKNPALAFGSNVPFGLNADQQNAWLYYGGGLEAMRKIYAPYGIINFPAGNTGVQMGGWFRREIKSLTDLKGIRMRIPGFGGEVMKRLGVDVKVYSADKIVPALIADEIDAVEWNNPYDDEIMGLPKAAPYYYYPGWWEPGATYELQVNLEQWQLLPPEYQTILQVAASNTNITMLAQYNARNGKVLKRLKESGTKFRPFQQEIMEAAYQEAFEIYDEYATKDATFSEVYQQWKTFRAEVYQWILDNEINYFDFSMQAANS